MNDVRGSRRYPLISVVALLLLLPLPVSCAQQQLTETAEIKHFRIRSELLSAFRERDTWIEAGVVLPPDRAPGERPPIAINIHGFGGSHRGAWRSGPGLVEAMRADTLPRMIYVFPNAQFEYGHHEFADSAHNGPWGEAFTTEFIPALEARFEAWGAPEGRLLCGHSSGGWSSLWLQVAYPDFFGGTWSTAPDPVDFRDFTGVNIYAWDNAFTDPDGNEIFLMRRNGEWTTSLREFTRQEFSRQESGGQMASFDAVFSPVGPDGRPRPLYDHETGAIDHEVARAWERYDIALVLRRNWAVLGPKLQGKLRVYCGLWDTFRLEGAVILLRDALQELGSDAEIVLIPERDHGSLGAPHELWPDGLYPMIYRQMFETFQRATGRPGTAHRPEAETVNPGREFGIVASNAFLYYRDLERATDFYTRTLGLQLAADYGFAKILRVAATSFLTLVDGTAGMHTPEEPKTVALALITDQLDAWYTYLRDQDVTMRSGYDPVPGRPHHGFVIVDPEGYLLEFERFNPHPENDRFTPLLDALPTLSPPQDQSTTVPSGLGFKATILWLYYRDCDAIRDFYARTIGLEEVVDQGWAWIYRASPAGFIGPVDESRGMHRWTEEKAVTVSFFTDRLDDWFEYVRRTGAFALRHDRIQEDDGGRFRVFVGYDPEGYYLEFDTFLPHELNTGLLGLLEEARGESSAISRHQVERMVR